MNCKESIDAIVQYMEDLLPEEEKKRMEAHLAKCSRCRGELETLSKLHSRLIQAGSENKSADFEYKVIDRIIREQNRKLNRTGGLRRRFSNWRFSMKSKAAKLSAAATVAIALIFGIGIFTNIPPVATADAFLAQAMDALTGLSSVHMKAQMRSRLADNFGSICLECDFVPVEMWKKHDNRGALRWRLEKPMRAIVMDGESTTMVVGGEWASRHEKAELPGDSFDAWMGRLMDVHALLDSELQQATLDPVRQLVLSREEIDGRNKILLEVDVTTDVPENDYCRDGFVENTDHLKVYRFDAETKLLEGFQLFVISGDRDVLVFEITDIEYDATIDDELLALELAPDIILWQQPALLSDNEKYQNMTPREAAEVIFRSCAEKNWGEFAKFLPASGIRQSTKDTLGGLEILSIGEPFQSGSEYPGWFVPFEIRLRDASIYQGNMALRNDNDAERFVIDGGL